MKKSNKLLFGGFLALLLLITIIHLTLYAKYKAGDYSVYNAEEEFTNESMQLFPNVLVVNINDISGATIKFSDAARVEKAEDQIQYTQKGDTLMISPKVTSHIEDQRHSFLVHVPYRAKLSVFNSLVYVKPSQKPSQDSSAMYLDKSTAVFPEQKGAMHHGHLGIAAFNESLVVFVGKAQVDYLNIQLSNSGVEARESNFGQLSITADSVSRLYLPAKYLSKTNINTTNR
jgi:hypothetical protein